VAIVPGRSLCSLSAPPASNLGPGINQRPPCPTPPTPLYPTPIPQLSAPGIDVVKAERRELLKGMLAQPPKVGRAGVGCVVAWNGHVSLQRQTGG